jgi:hypothetical protein
VKHVVNFSGGLCSFWAAHRVVQEHGVSDVVLLFADTLIEDPDLYSFNEQCAEILGVPVTRISAELTPWQLFQREGMIGNSRFPICSVYLKRKPLDAWRKANCVDIDTVLYMGFDWTEANRLSDLRRELPDWKIEAPMTEEPIWDKCRMQKEAEALGLKIPRLYTLGFPHNNCGGRCVRAGISHWVHLLKVLPERFKEWENEERATALELTGRGITPLSILKDRRGGVTNDLYLWQLRERVEAGEKFNRFDWGGCGCGGATTATKPPTTLTQLVRAEEAL